MSLAGKLISAALTVGTVAAVGYGVKKLEQKVKDGLFPQEEPPEQEILGGADATVISVEQKEGDWSYRMQQKGIVRETEQTLENGVRTIRFVPVKDGVTEVELDYFLNNNSAATITYRFEVKGGKIIRSDAAGDLELLCHAIAKNI